MSSSIDNLRNNIQDKDTQLVDSILQDMKQNKQPQQMNQEPELTPEQEKELYLRQQQELEYQQKMIHQQMMEQQQGQQQEQPTMIANNTTDNFIDNLKNESKYIVLVIFLGLLFNLDMVNELFKSTNSSIFVNLESKDLTIQSSLIKALLMGVLFYVIKTFLI